MKVIRNKSILIALLFMFFTYSNPITVFAAQNIKNSGSTTDEINLEEEQDIEEVQDLSEIKIKYQSELKLGLDNLEDSIKITDICNKLNVNDIKTIKSWTSEFLYKPEYFYLQGYDLNYNYYKLNGTLESMTFIPKYRDNDKEKIIKYRTELNNKIEEIINLEIKDWYSDFQKEYAIVNYLLKNCQYDYEGYNKNDIQWECFTAYGALINNLSVCQGYAESLKLLLNACGIYCEVVTGTAGENDEGHAWNIVNIDGKYYQIDVTWMDTEGGNYKFEYFNITDDDMSQNHKYDKTNINQSINNDFKFFNDNINQSSYYNSKSYSNETALMYFLEDGKIVSKDIFGNNEKVIIDKSVTNITGIYDSYLVYTEIIDNQKILVRLNLLDNTKTIIKVFDEESILLCTLTENNLKVVSYNKDDSRDTNVFDLSDNKFEDSDYFEKNDSENNSNDNIIENDDIDSDNEKNDYTNNDIENEDKENNNIEDINKEDKNENKENYDESQGSEDKNNEENDYKDDKVEDKENEDEIIGDKDKDEEQELGDNKNNNDNDIKVDTSKEENRGNINSNNTGSEADTGDENVIYVILCSMICSLYFLKRNIN